MLDKPDSFLETLVSAMFTFATARGVNRCWLSPVYPLAEQAVWQAIANRVGADGRVDAICVGTTAAYDTIYYCNRPTDTLTMQGYRPVLMAGAKVITMLRSFDINDAVSTFHYRPRKR